jgi:glycosyltransferase involved in cell wall biosynthesis
MLRSALYISYFGIREPLVQTQVLTYLRELVAGGWNIHLITFEKGWPDSFSNEELKFWQNKLQNEGITWHINKYTDSRSLKAKIRDIFSGLRQARTIIRKNDIKIVHGRAHVGTMIGELSRFFLKVKLLFDIRGFNPEEQVESGRWSQRSLKYFIYKTAEKYLLMRASGFILLTNAGRKALFPQSIHQPGDPQELYRLPDKRPIQIIPCCVDDSRFEMKLNQKQQSNLTKETLGLGNCLKIIAHVGALGGLYPEERIVKTFAEIKKQYPDYGFIILSQTSTNQFKELYEAASLPADSLWVGKVPVSEVANYLAICDWGLSLKKESYSQLSCSPTKIPEYLLAGLPVISSKGIGDTDKILTENEVGLVFNAWDDADIVRCVSDMSKLEKISNLRQKCQETAINLFDLRHVGGPRYRGIYETLING